MNVGHLDGEGRSLDQGRKGDWRMKRGGKGRNLLFFSHYELSIVLGNSRLTVL